MRLMDRRSLSKVFLESQRTPTTPVSSSSDAEVPDEGSLQEIFDRVVQSGKWQCPVMIHGFVMTPAAHCVLESGGVRKRSKLA